jgi:hypothetical protein
MNTQIAQSNGVGAVDFFKVNKPSQAFTALDPSQSLAEGIGASYPVIGYKGKIWSLRTRGESHIFLRPDDGTPIGYIDVVILRSAPVKAKSYYLAGAFDEQQSQGKRPICASIDGIKPDLDVLDKQADVCALCPRNEWRTDANGRKGRDCSDYKRLAVLLLPNQTAKMFGQALVEPVFLRVPPDSLNDLAVFGENMAQQGWPYSSFVTRISFDSTKSHPKFVFKAVQALTDTEAATVIGLREDVVSKRITGEDEIARRTATQTNGVRQQVRDSAPPAGAPAAVSQTRVIPPELSKPKSNPTALAEDKQQAQSMERLIEMTAGAGGAFSVEKSPEPSPSINPGAMVGQTADDVGSAGEGDADLDARIAAMLAT